jgi:hypothetical protein
MYKIKEKDIVAKSLFIVSTIIFTVGFTVGFTIGLLKIKLLKFCSTNWA